jgi:hypothetical protein
MSRWPTRKDYSTALRNPATSFKSQDLQNSRIEKHGLGHILSSGNFACIAKAEIEGKLWALRLFLKEQQGVEQRYAALESRLSKLKPYFVDFSFHDNEISLPNLGGQYPVMRMEWVDGVTLGAFIITASRMRDTAKMRWVRDELVKVREFLRKSEIAHGDLSADNVVIRTTLGRDELVLVDYDGVWMHEIAELPTSVGVGQLQHPQRTNPTGPYADNMAFEIMDLALAYLEKFPEVGADPGLFDQKFVISAQDLQSMNSELIKSVQAASPDGFRRTKEYALGGYEVVPHIFVPEPESPASEGTDEIVDVGNKVEAVTVRELARQMDMPRRDLLVMCRDMYKGDWSFDRLLTRDQVKNLLDAAARKSAKRRSQVPPKPEPYKHVTLLWLSSRHGIAVEELRGIFWTESALKDINLPIWSTERFRVEVQTLNKLEKAIDRYKIAAQEVDTNPNTPWAINQNERATGRIWTYTLESLANMFGLMRSDLEKVIVEIGLKPPPLSDMDIVLSDADLARIEKALAVDTEEVCVGWFSLTELGELFGSDSTTIRNTLSLSRFGSNVPSRDDLKFVVYSRAWNHLTLMFTGGDIRRRKDFEGKIERLKQSNLRTTDGKNKDLPITGRHRRRQTFNHTANSLARLNGVSVSFLRQAIKNSPRVRPGFLPVLDNEVIDVDAGTLQLVADAVIAHVTEDPSSVTTSSSTERSAETPNLTTTSQRFWRFLWLLLIIAAVLQLHEWGVLWRSP